MDSWTAITATILSVAVLIVLVTLYGWGCGAINREYTAKLRGAHVAGLLDALTGATGGAEPVRADVRYPEVQRFVFCGRDVFTGHSPDCVWQAAVRWEESVEREVPATR